MHSVTIGNNVLIAAGSIATKSVPYKVVVAENPFGIICTIEEYAMKKLRYNTHTKGFV